MKKKCYCEREPHTECGDCGKWAFTADEVECEDIRSALSYFVRTWPDRKGSVQTRKAMAVLDKKIVRELRRLRRGDA